ncbi:MAG: acetyl-CoA C-acyltransferase [Nitrospinaceae bacterium]|nr:thiolase family protein [Nitrospinaceae bacterium]NIR57763.1 thiolase family protein [Nitrospinaceae bacterium]NIS88225.1 thiolase family protein [Nitrospinaceae bacterium]NIT85105.1 thiolase family protein [Nitrospinaceae bacterium]NIU47262.1 thiolase family protein [Nitrospinaceae bacterium]
MKNESAYIYGAVRTPIGKVPGALSTLSAVQLAALAIREAVERSGVSPVHISDVILGNVLSAGLGQAPARQALMQAGLPESVRGMIVNKVCGSGLQAVMLANDLIRLGDAEYVVAGGMENMSQVPFLHTRHLEEGKEASEPLDSLVYDGLWDSFGDCHMGHIAEDLAQHEPYSREAQDRFALESYQRARQAQDDCRFSNEIVAVPVFKEGETLWIDRDEQPYAHDLNKLPRIPPAFDKEHGTVTAGNSSSINDGAAALVLGPYNESLQPMARLAARASHSMDPSMFPLAPIYAIEQLLDRWGLRKQDIDLYEINEAFAVTAMTVIDRMGLDRERVNVHGGAVALGHPIGASGARILVTLLHALQARNAKRGIAAICIGGGESVAVGVERMREEPDGQ